MGSAGSCGSWVLGAAAAADGIVAGLDLEVRLMRSSNIAISRSGRLPIILYVCFSPACNKKRVDDYSQFACGRTSREHHH